MKLLESLRQKVYEEQAKIADTFAKAVGFNGIHDTNTVIERKNAQHAWKFIVQNKQLLIDSFPKENIKKLEIRLLRAVADWGPFYEGPARQPSPKPSQRPPGIHS